MIGQGVIPGPKIRTWGTHMRVRKAVLRCAQGDKGNKQRKTPAAAGVFCWRKVGDYIAATKSGRTMAALSCSSWVMRAAIDVYIDAARKALTRTPSLAWVNAY